ncbi:tetratricopeptide repeat protein [Corallibacter vietnamensis]|uniref:Tetratricopeptide repeat protein n=1 Tax=Corallibacter vietnamensis TaxID=904130 RepID=A0ABP7H5N5_9FLAO
MNKDVFTHILQNPGDINSEQTNDLKDIIDTFPYFQSARAIFLKGLKNNQNFKYNQALKTTAAYTTDRSILFDFITSDAFLQNEISQYIKQHSEHVKDITVDIEDLSVNKSVTIDDTLKKQIKDTTGVLDPKLFQPKIKQSDIADSNTETESNTTQTENPETVLNLGAPLEFNNSETHSFNEWLKLTRFTPIDRESSQKDTSSQDVSKDNSQDERKKKFDLIEKFISKNPKLVPEKSSGKNTNLAEEQMIQPESLMTETLARIYLEQKNYKKAIQSYNILSLKYPEKSGFFADQIKAIKQLQEQNNKK